MLFMRSDGGLTPMQHFSGARAILSGPAGGVVGYAMTTYRHEDGQPVIGFDMGGERGRGGGPGWGVQPGLSRGPQVPRRTSAATPASTSTSSRPAPPASASRHHSSTSTPWRPAAAPGSSSGGWGLLGTHECPGQGTVGQGGPAEPGSGLAAAQRARPGPSCSRRHLPSRSGLYVVGPESAGAHPGPACYRKGECLRCWRVPYHGATLTVPVSAQGVR